MIYNYVIFILAILSLICSFVQIAFVTHNLSDWLLIPTILNMQLIHLIFKFTRIKTDKVYINILFIIFGILTLTSNILSQWLVMPILNIISIFIIIAGITYDKFGYVHYI